jgi:hypothetical protein
MRHKGFPGLQLTEAIIRLFKLKTGVMVKIKYRIKSRYFLSQIHHNLPALDPVSIL